MATPGVMVTVIAEFGGWSLVGLLLKRIDFSSFCRRVDWLRVAVGEARERVGQLPHVG